MKTKGDVFIRIVSERLDIPEWRIRARLDQIAAVRQPPDYFYDEISDTAFEQLANDPKAKEDMAADVFGLLEIFHDA